MWNVNNTRKHKVQKVKSLPSKRIKLTFTINTTVPIYAMYTMHINLTPKGIYTKLSVFHQYVRQMGKYIYILSHLELWLRTHRSAFVRSTVLSTSFRKSFFFFFFFFFFVCFFVLFFFVVVFSSCCCCCCCLLRALDRWFVNLHFFFMI